MAELISQHKETKMKGIRELIVKLPELCGAEDADRHEWRNGAVYDADANKLTTVFDRRNGESIRKRLRLVQDWVDSGYPDYEKADYGFRLQAFAALSIDINNGRAEKDESYTREYESLELLEFRYPDISSILTVKEASALLGWAPA
jgi:hypothetical protein